MFKKIIPVLALVAALAACATEPEQNPEVENVSTYDQLVSQWIKGQTIDFTELRMAYRDSAYFDVAGPPEIDKLKELYDTGLYEAAAALAEDNKRRHLGSVEFCHYAMLANRALIRDNENDFYTKTFWGLMDSLLASGNGHSPASAVEVIMVQEEYLFMNTYGIDYGLQSLTDYRGSTYDMFETVPNQYYGEERIFFNVDMVFLKYAETYGQ